MTVATTYPIWHPFTQMKTAPPPLKVASGKGAMLTLADGRQIVDCISSWWVTLHGHAQPEIAEAIAEQAQKLEQVIFAGFTHEPAESLATKVLAHLPKQLTRVFFSDNGSTAMEVAVKMAYQYWQNLGHPERNRFIGFQNGYHGDTIGAMSAGSTSAFWGAFKPLMFEIDVVDFPQTFDADPNPELAEEKSLLQLRALLERSPASYAAIIVEPLIQGAAGMHMCRPSYLKALRKIADQYDVLLIFDEVMTGFGRTGDWFAANKAATAPDIISLSKGLTGGFLPLSMTVASEKIYQAFLADDLGKAFFHSHSFMGNPISCAAGLASLQLLDRTRAFAGVEEIHRLNAERYLSDFSFVVRKRYCGTVAAFDLSLPGQNNYFCDLSPKLRQAFLNKNLLLRPLANTVYLMLPYCAEANLIASVYEKIADVLRSIPEFA